MHDPVRQSFINTPPRASQCAAKAVTTTSASQDLRLIGTQTPSNNTDVPGIPDHFVTLFADGGDVYVLFGATAPTADETSTTTNGATTCWKIASGTSQRFRCMAGLDNFVAYKTASGTATLRIYQSSP